jgi:hypothetical protein
MLLCVPNKNRGRKMVARNELRKEAYQYILYLLSHSPDTMNDNNSSQFMPLEELRLVKEGFADPSPALVSLLKQLLHGAISDSTIDAHLVTPFRHYQTE